MHFHLICRFRYIHSDSNILEIRFRTMTAPRSENGLFEVKDGSIPENKDLRGNCVMQSQRTYSDVFPEPLLT